MKRRLFEIKIAEVLFLKEFSSLYSRINLIIFDIKLICDARNNINHIVFNDVEKQKLDLKKRKKENKKIMKKK